ncbi:heme oxygenase [Rhodopseudomonas rhenobacensis]|uniref:heme oxygenase (biliverdin-producing) n=1 Tax=Rhodopseudomonas rhenobacensis TaxID=87461 RepID=A0A7W7Z8Z9_9BRAD|nr:biliverdin-producing heme oxygenase [Rhodopseudomonas rhenobacensis]MBB5049722.1 heme oxygenase [Rhodopseudomonas rhenobacensis]
MTAAAPTSSVSSDITTSLYHRTRALHLEAEKTGIIADLLRGQATRPGYALLLRNLFPAYRELENGLARHQDSPGLDRLKPLKLRRTQAIESDLIALCGPDWANTVPWLPAGQAYAKRIAEVAEGDGMLLIAHAYTRYLGDLNGGQIVQRLLANTYKLRPCELSHYDFSGFPNPSELKNDYRAALNQAAAASSDPDAIIEEGATAFTLNIGLSVAVQNQLRQNAPVAS